MKKFLDKFHQPGKPSYTIITDPEYYVFLWFHDALGNLIKCPYLIDEYTPKLKDSYVEFGAVNRNYWGDEGGIQSGSEDVSLDDKCLDLTPFVREATLPEIAPANGEKIRTLFGDTTAGSFSPYASDGSKPITLNMLDTEYSILDAIFYPWMKDINSPWWYRPDKAFTEWATPYPMATLEVYRPRMRYIRDGKTLDSRFDAQDAYTYYSYKFLGVKPTSYSSFPINGAGVTNLNRNLSLICDMCLVDLTSDAHITQSTSINFGNRRGFVFQDPPAASSDQDSDEQDNDED